MKKLAIFLILIVITACTGPNHSFTIRKPLTLDMNPPEGPREYQQGWVDGCESGIAATNNSVMMAVGAYKFTLDKYLRHDRLYNVAWQYGYNHCGYSMRSLAMYSF